MDNLVQEHGVKETGEEIKEFLIDWGDGTISTIWFQGDRPLFSIGGRQPSETKSTGTPGRILTVQAALA